MRKMMRVLLGFGATLAVVSPALADGIVSAIVNAPLSAAGTVRDARAGINVYLQRPEAPGLEFMDPNVLGFGIPKGGRLEIEMAEGFERDWAVGLSQAAIMLVTGAPQQGLPGKAVGYQVGASADDTLFVISPTGDKGLPAWTLVSPAPGSQKDPIRQRGIKVLHIGFQQSAFLNRGKTGTVKVRILDDAGKVVDQGSGTVDFLSAPVPQILPTNFSDGRRNHNWQRFKPGDVLGQTQGTLPIPLMLYARAEGSDPSMLSAAKDGILGAGVLSTQQLKATGFRRPAALARYTGGLILRDSDGNGALDPARDLIIGGVIGKAPAGAKGQELRSLERDGKPVLSQPTAAIVPKAGKRWGGAIMTLQFTAGDKPGKYRPTLALLRDPGDPSSGDGSVFTYTIVVE
ncbi:MAG: hypothetical protein V3S45_00520 [Kiloniellales bacterium]